MSLKYLAILFPLLLYVNGKKSFTLVIDTTMSMTTEIDIIKSNIGPIVNSIENSSSIENYIIVPFNDPDVGPAIVHTSPDRFVASISSLRLSGGSDIPEHSLSGLEKALQESKPESNIFLFTDACANDDNKFADVQQLCRQTRSKITIFLSGYCPYSTNNQFGRIGLYYDISKVCNGNVFELSTRKDTFKQAFHFMKEIVKKEYNDVTTFEAFTGFRQLAFSVDSYTSDVIVVVSGENPVLQLKEEGGQVPRTEGLIDIKRSLAVRIVNPQRGLYQSYVQCRGVTSVTIYKTQVFPFLIGFSSRRPITIKATSSKPLPAQENYILIMVPRTNMFQLRSLILQVLDGDRRQTLDLVESRTNSGVYITQAYFEAQREFRMTVYGRDSITSEEFSLSSKIMEPQIADTNAEPAAAVVEIIDPESRLTDYEKDATVACKVTGSPRPTIWWEDEAGRRMTAENGILEYPATHISYLSITHMTMNKTVSCKASTLNGSDAKSIELFVYRPYVFQMIQTPIDSTFEFEKEGKLFCQVYAYPEATLNWYHNETLLIFDDDDDHSNEDDKVNEITSASREIRSFGTLSFGFFGSSNKDKNDDRKDNGDVSKSDDGSQVDYILEDNALIIKSMSTKHTGTYQCRVRNEVNEEVFTVNVRISGLEPPEVQTKNTEITTQPGGKAEMLCRVTKGRPSPVVTWQFKPINNEDFTKVPEGVVVENEKLFINEVKTEHRGIYKCLATNDQGQGTREITLKVHYAPKIQNDATTTRNVPEETNVELPCLVDADPEATVRWELLQNNEIVALDERHRIDENNTHRFEALLKDSGTYRCIAENEAGTAEKIITINVHVSPYITPVPERIAARAGSDIVLPCNVHANPPVTLEWRFTALDSTPIVLFRGEWMNSKNLYLQNLRKSQAGAYSCVVRNSVGSDIITVALDIM